MSKTLSIVITDFFNCYLTDERGLSINTTKSYRDAFLLYFRYLQSSRKINFKKIDISIFELERIISFLNYLETDLKCSVNTRNQRLAAFKSFSTYAITKLPEYCSYFEAILNIKAKKHCESTVEYLTVDVIKRLLELPNQYSTNGVRDLAILSSMYETGCRVQELIDLKYEDIGFNSPHTVKLHGKGNKIRIVPISDNCFRIIEAYINRTKISFNDLIFTNKHNSKFTRAGITYILKKY